MGNKFADKLASAQEINDVATVEAMKKEMSKKMMNANSGKDKKAAR